MVRARIHQSTHAHTSHTHTQTHILRAHIHTHTHTHTSYRWTCRSKDMVRARIHQTTHAHITHAHTMRRHLHRVDGRVDWGCDLVRAHTPQHTRTHITRTHHTAITHRHNIRIHRVQKHVDRGSRSDARTPEHTHAHLLQGNITLGLFGDIAPLTVQNLVGLMNGSLEAANGYTGAIFHRIIYDFMMQVSSAHAPLAPAPGVTSCLGRWTRTWTQGEPVSKVLHTWRS